MKTFLDPQAGCYFSYKVKVKTQIYIA